MSDINVAASIDVGKNTQALIEKLAAQIGVTVDKVWPWLVKQQVLEAYSQMAVSVAVIVLGSIMFYAGARVGTKYGWPDTPITALAIGLCVLGGMGLVVGLLAGAFGGASWIQAINNPEYAALKELMSMVKP